MNFRRTKILIVNDQRDCGVSYGPFFTSFGDVVSKFEDFRRSPYKYRAVVFTGGSDVSPSLYRDDSPKGICRTNPKRDREEAEIFRIVAAAKVPMIGICRGMQFINVMTGGKLIHDVTGHSHGNHLVSARDCRAPFSVNSFHHQMCIPNQSTIILAWSTERLSKNYIGYNDEKFDYSGPEVEAIYCPTDRCLGVQWHPEAMPEDSKGRSWVRWLISDFLKCSEIGFENLYMGYPKIRTTICQ